MVGSPLVLLGLLAGWADPCCKGTTKVTECNPKRPLIKEVEDESVCPENSACQKKYIFSNAANFPDYRFSEPPRVSPSLWIPAPERGEFCPPGIICSEKDNKLQPQGFFIHEGMTLRIGDQGKFSLVFQATTPDTTVDLRLKFTLSKKQKYDKCKDNPPCIATGMLCNPMDTAESTDSSCAPNIITLTLPPIVIPPKTVDGIDLFLANPKDTQDQTRFVTVVYEGYSPLLELHNKTSCSSNFSIQRCGKARFGTPLSR